MVRRSSGLRMSEIRAARWPIRASLTLCCLWVQLTLGLAPGNAEANVIDKLLRRGELACEPAWPFFCGNIHVACAGQTTLRTFAFTLRASGAGITLAAREGGSGIAEAYAQLSVAPDVQNQAVVLMPASKDGYLKLQADGGYSFRHYVAHRGIMSSGRCE